MMRAALLMVMGTAAFAGESEPFRGASGVEYLPFETLFDPEGATPEARQVVRMRLLAPQISDHVQFGFDVIEPDLMALCKGEGLRIVADAAPNAAEIVVSVASEALPFGESAPNVVQYFDVFSIAGGTCVWGGI